ncbi:MAG: HesB/IscA family protein [Gammaproteobacteria bacterium WSBS_2016_MAG_OTU1]
MSVSLTAAAAVHVRSCLSERPSAGIRLAVRPSGCSGLAYVVEFADDIQEGELTFDSHGVTIITDPRSLVHIEGMEVDYVREGLQAGLKFNNPNVKDSCGCGESFTT